MDHPVGPRRTEVVTLGKLHGRGAIGNHRQRAVLDPEVTVVPEAEQVEHGVGGVEGCADFLLCPLAQKGEARLVPHQLVTPAGIADFVTVIQRNDVRLARGDPAELTRRPRADPMVNEVHPPLLLIARADSLPIFAANWSRVMRSGVPWTTKVCVRFTGARLPCDSTVRTPRSPLGVRVSGRIASWGLPLRSPIRPMLGTPPLANGNTVGCDTMVFR